MNADPHESGTLAVLQALPYALVAVGLLGGLSVVLFRPLSTPALNVLVGGALLAVAVGSVALMVADHAGPGDRGPEF